MKTFPFYLPFLCFAMSATAAPVERPNIVFLLSDDQDWTGLSVQMHPDLPNSKSDFYRTPNLEKFAAQGMRFSAAYAPAPVCSPTRISLQTGMSPAKLGWTKAAPAEEGHKLIEGANRKSIRHEETTIGEMLQGAGYATAHYGKWHLSGGGPEANGYDESDGDTGNRDADAFVDPNPVDIFGMTERATAFMEKQSRAGKPFFVQMSYYALHLPENALRATRAFYESQSPGRMHADIDRAAITTDLDTGVGRLLESIDRLGLAKNTYVIYLSDNGAGGGGKGGVRPLSAGKGGVWEGGIRVPLIVRGPGIAADSWCHERVVGYDFFPTFCRWAGVKEPLPEGLEGGDLTPLLFEGARGPVQRAREELVFHFPHYQGDTPHSAILMGDQKLIHFYETGESRLFDLKKDLAESNDISAAQPEIVSDLKRRLESYLAEVGAAMPETNPYFDPAKEPAGKGGGKGGKGKDRTVMEEGPAVEEEPAPPMTEPERPRGGGGQVSALFLALDRDGDREVSSDEMANATETLLSLDANQSGQLEPDEIVAAAPRRVESVAPSETVSKSAAGWIAEHAGDLDLNGDGSVGRTELMDQARTAFAAFDADGNGVLKPEEYSGRQPKSPVAAYLTGNAESIDADGNRWISAGEFAAALTKELAAVDGNHVGPASRRSAEPGNDRRDASPTWSAEVGKDRRDAGPTWSPATKPNVVLFLIDDMGWRDVGFAGNPVIDTPNCDRLAREGTVFTQAYASAPNCAPTRACLMSGQYTPRHGVYTVVDDRHLPGSPHHKVLATESNAELSTESVTIAESLRAGGYATGMMGMWNLGRGNNGPVTPTGQGFDVFKDPKTLGFEKDAYQRADGAYLTDEFTTAGIEWIEANRDRPFFLYMAYHAVHAPYDPKPELAEKYRRKAAETGEDIDVDYAATVEALDQNVGRFLAYLDETGLAENTIVIFTSDNGGTRQYTAPLNSGKGSLYEGGIRVPFVARGPGIRAGASSAEPILSMDLYPTLLEFAGLPSPSSHRLDGTSLRSLLAGETTSLGRERVFWHFPCYVGGGSPTSAMRQGNWKAIEFFETQTVEIYDLSKDPGETTDLSKKMPDQARELTAALHAWQEETGAPRPTAPNPNYDPSAQPDRGKGRVKAEAKRRAAP